MDDRQNLEAQLLGDMTYEDPRQKQAQPAVDPRLAGASIPMLDSMDANAAPASKPQTRWQELTDEQIAILQQQRAAAGHPPYTPDEIAELKAEFIERQRIQAQQQAMAEQAAAQQQAAAMLLEEPAYTAPEKKQTHEPLPQVDASALLEEPAPEPERRVAFNQEDLDAAKKQAAKRASESLKEAPQQTAEQQKRAREEMAMLRRQQQQDLAQKGLAVSIVMTVLSVIAGVCTIMFSSGGYGNPDEAPAIFHFFDKCYLFLGIAQALLGVTIVLRVKQVKGFTSFINVITPLLMLIPGITLLLSQKKSADGGAVSVVCYIIAMLCSIVVTFIMSTSEPLNAYYAKSDVMYD